MHVHPPILLGHSPVTLTIVDDAHQGADALRAAALRESFARESGDLYPGLRASVPTHYADWLCGTTAAAGVSGSAEVLRSTFAIATDAAADLAPIQRIPHFDTTDPNVIAAVHYLCDPPHGGTRFYRHLRTGYERVEASCRSAWRQALLRDAGVYGLPQHAYADGEVSGYEEIGKADLRFNRLIFYPANCLHAGNIPEAHLSASPAKGRLTVTSLVRVHR